MAYFIGSYLAISSIGAGEEGRLTADYADVTDVSNQTVMVLSLNPLEMPAKFTA
jgi:hypothetical protein